MSPEHTTSEPEKSNVNMNPTTVEKNVNMNPTTFDKNENMNPTTVEKLRRVLLIDPEHTNGKHKSHSFYIFF